MLDATPLVDPPALTPTTATTPAPAPSPTTTGKPLPAPRPGRLYDVVWRWHFYAGLITAPILWIVTITGALYVFRTELVEWRDRALLRVAPQASRLSYDDLRQRAVAALGTSELHGMTLRAEPESSVSFVAESELGDGEHEHHRVYLDPYTGHVLGKRVDEHDFFAIVLDLHRSLMLGSTGRAISELATSWGVILVATGVYLWWPRGRSNVGVWAPRVRGKLYAVLRDWHSVLGMYFAALLVIVSVTGLVFSLVLGMTFNTTAQKIGHWPMVWFKTPASTPAEPGAPPASLDRVVATVLAQARPDDAALIALAEAPDLAHKGWLIQDDDKNTLRMVTVDQYSGEQIAKVDAADTPFLYRVRLWSVSTHMGKIFGMPTKILALLATLVMFGLSVTGVWMWWKRRPRGRTGFPRRPPMRTVPKWGWLIVLIGGILFPVAGASMLLAGMLEGIGALLWRKQAA